MTIKYLDSKRIVKLSTDVVETSVYETETFTPAWYTSGGQINVANSQIEVRFDGSTNADSGIGKDISSFLAGADLGQGAWTLDFDLHFGTLPSNNGYFQWSFGMSDKNWGNTAGNIDQDAYVLVITGLSGSTYRYRIYSLSNTDIIAGGTAIATFTRTAASDQVDYCRMKSDGTTLTVELFEDANRSTLNESQNVPINSSITGLKYIKTDVHDQSSQTTFTVDIKKVTLWESSLTSKPTNVENNSILVEKDTANRFWFDVESTSDVTWDDSTDVGCSISGNTVTKTSGNSWTSGVAKTDEVISASSGGTITMTSNAINTYIGLSNVATLNQQAKHWYDVKLGFNQNSVIENGAIVSPDTAFTRVTSDTMKITVSSAGLVKYYINDVLKHTSTITASGTYFGIFSAYNTNETLTATITTPATWTMNPTYESDFSTNAGWTNNGNTSVGQVNTTTKVLDAIGNVSTLCGVTRDLGAVDSTFLLRFKLGITVATQYTGGATSAKVNIGLFSSDYDGRASQELIALDVNAFDNSYRFKAGGAITPDGGGDTGAGNYGVETRWVEIKRLASGDCKLTIFTDEYSTEEGSKTSTPSGTITSALRYLGVKSGNTGSGDGNNALTVDDIEFYNGVTSIN